MTRLSIKKKKSSISNRSSSSAQTSSSTISSNSTIYKNYLPLDDSEYPYSGIPRIVIETEDFKKIADKETEIPAKLQIYGINSPESEIMDLTIKGRGNTTWQQRKKPYTIKFEDKQNFLGMKKAKKWVLLANYFDRTLMRNAVSLEIGKKTRLEWTPEGKFVDVFLNKQFIGNYYICEKIQVNKNRLNINESEFLLELDTHYDEEYKFRTPRLDLPVNIKNPDNPTENQIRKVTNLIDSIECILENMCPDLSLENYIDLQSFADYLIVYEMARNAECSTPKSLFMYTKNGKIYAGPIWDFDWATYNIDRNGWRNKKSKIFGALLNNNQFRSILKECWMFDKEKFKDIPSFIDSLANYISMSDKYNHTLWPVKIDNRDFADKDKSFDEAIEMLKKAFFARIEELDSMIGNL